MALHIYISHKCHATFTPIKGLSSLKGTCAQFTHTGGKGNTAEEAAVQKATFENCNPLQITDYPFGIVIHLWQYSPEYPIPER